MSESYHRRLEQIKGMYSRAYEKWTESDESLLADMFLSGKSVNEISSVLQRQPSAIRARLQKLNLATAISKNDIPDKGSFKIHFSFQWQPVQSHAEQPYRFPQPITLFMKHRYKGPAIYRWIIYQTNPQHPSLLYIGSTKKLCPNRLDGYLKPSNSSTNQRVNTILREYLDEGFHVRLEILVNCALATDDKLNTPFHFRTQSRRTVLEELLIDYYRHQGFQLINQ